MTTPNVLTQGTSTQSGPPDPMELLGRDAWKQSTPDPMEQLGAAARTVHVAGLTLTPSVAAPAAAGGSTAVRAAAARVPTAATDATVAPHAVADAQDPHRLAIAPSEPNASAHELGVIGRGLSMPLEMGAHILENPIGGAADLALAPVNAAKTVAEYSGQRAAELTLPDDVRRLAEADPDRIRGSDAAIAAAQVAATVAAPGISKFVGGATEGLLGDELAHGLGHMTAGSVGGAAFDPHDPVAGAIGGAALTALPATRAASRIGDVSSGMLESATHNLAHDAAYDVQVNPAGAITRSKPFDPASAEGVALRRADAIVDQSRYGPPASPAPDPMEALGAAAANDAAPQPNIRVNDRRASTAMLPAIGREIMRTDDEPSAGPLALVDANGRELSRNDAPAVTPPPVRSAASGAADASAPAAPKRSPTAPGAPVFAFRAGTPDAELPATPAQITRSQAGQDYAAEMSSSLTALQRRTASAGSTASSAINREFASAPMARLRGPIAAGLLAAHEGNLNDALTTLRATPQGRQLAAHGITDADVVAAARTVVDRTASSTPRPLLRIGTSRQAANAESPADRSGPAAANSPRNPGVIRRPGGVRPSPIDVVSPVGANPRPEPAPMPSEREQLVAAINEGKPVHLDTLAKYPDLVDNLRARMESASFGRDLNEPARVPKGVSRGAPNGIADQPNQLIAPERAENGVAIGGTGAPIETDRTSGIGSVARTTDVAGRITPQDLAPGAEQREPAPPTDPNPQAAVDAGPESMADAMPPKLHGPAPAPETRASADPRDDALSFLSRNDDRPSASANGSATGPAAGTTAAPIVSAARPHGEQMLNLAKFGLETPLRERLQAKVDQLDAAGSLQKGYRSFAEQHDEARAFARDLVANPLDIDPKKLAKLNGAQIVGLHQVVAENTALMEAASRALVRDDLPPEQIEAAQRILDRTESSTNDALAAIVREKAEAGRTLGFLRQVAHNTLDPDVWVMQAQKLAGDVRLGDGVLADIRRLAREAAEACTGGGA